MLRRLLAALLLSGAALSLAQTPPTLSPQGSAVVAIIEGYSDGNMESIAAGYDNSSSVSITNSINYTVQGYTYNGSHNLTGARSALNQAFGIWYNDKCRVTPCGTLSASPGEQGSSSGTSVDEWYWMTFDTGTYAFPNITGNAYSSATPGEFKCTKSDGSRWDFQSSSALNNQSVMAYRTGWRTVSSSGTAGSWQYTSSAVTDQAGPLSAIKAKVSELCGTITLAAWRTGSYVNRGSTAPVAHSDVSSGLRKILAEVQAELDRRSGPFLIDLLNGTSLTPTPEDPSAPAGDYDDDGIPDDEDPCPTNPDAECTGEGDGGTIVDPGNCDEGWFLTQVVCEIRTTVNNTWQFISHDAWVPEESWSSRAETLRTQASEKFPFNTFEEQTWENFNHVIAGGYTSESGVQAKACAIHTPSWNFKLGSLTQVETPSFDICDNAFGDWMHRVGRRLLFYVAGLAITWGLFQRVSQSA